MEVHKGLTDCPICGKVQSKAHKLFFSCPPPSPSSKFTFFIIISERFHSMGWKSFFGKKNVFYLEKSIKKFLKNYSHLRGVWLNKVKLTSVLISLTIYMMPKSYSNIFILDFKLKETPGDGSQGRDGSAVTSSLNQSDYFWNFILNINLFLGSSVTVSLVYV